MSKKEKQIYEGFKKIKRSSDNQAEVIPDLKAYLIDQQNSERAQLAGEIFYSVGTDSKFHPRKGGWSVTYATVLAMTFNKRGTHLIARKEIRSGVGKLSLFDRLWLEVEMSVQLALWMREEFNIECEVHLDVNPNKEFDSNVLYEAAIGYAKSLGFVVEAKPDSPVAMNCADHLLRNKLYAA